MIYIALTVGKCWENTHNIHPILIYDPYRIRWGLQFFLPMIKTPSTKVICHIYHKPWKFLATFQRQRNASSNGGPILYLYCRNHAPWISFVPRETPRDLSIAQERGRERPSRCEGQCPQHVRARRTACCFTGHALESTYIHTHIITYQMGPTCKMHVCDVTFKDVDLTNNNTD